MARILLQPAFLRLQHDVSHLDITSFVADVEMLGIIFIVFAIELVIETII